MAAYVPLTARSNFSFLEGASHPDELVERCAELGIGALGLTDRDGVHGLVRAWVRGRELGVRIVAGSEVTIDDGSTLHLIATDRAAYGRLCTLVTAGRLRSPKGESRVTWDEVIDHADGLVALWGGRRGALATREVLPERVGQLREAFGDRLYAALARHRTADELVLEQRVLTQARRHDLPIVAARDVRYHVMDRRPLHDVMTCIRHGRTLHDVGRRTEANAEHALMAPAALERLYADVPGALARTVEIAARCSFDLGHVDYRYPAEDGGDGRDSSARLRALTWDGARRRYRGEIPDSVTAQIERELVLIDELDYGGYFLTMHDIVAWCRQQGILCQGRGSAANSSVCYCLGITAVDPVRLELLFERFISRERAEPPDIDLDIAHERREEVIQWVYERYGRSHAAMVANVIRYRPRSAVRDVGRALGIPAMALDRVAKLLSHHAHADDATIRDAGLDPEAPLYRHLVRLCSDLLDTPRHLSIHPGGFILGRDPVHTLVPIENATMPGRTVIQWDKYDVEALGLFKVDLLGLGALTHIDRCVTLIERHEDTRIDLAAIPADDPATFDMIGRAETVGVFQIESRAQMSMLPRLRPRTFYDLVIEVSIVRPGPISGDMVHPYLRRRRGEEPVTYPHACLEPVLARTLGVPLFQEQVMKLAVVAADYTPGEADQLRRDMAAWRQEGRIDQHRERLVARMKAKGIAEEFAERVFQQIRGFGEYGFPESHAASFALISYATAWLRCHHPAAFTASLLNSQPMGFYSVATIVEEAQRRGLTIRAIDATCSALDCTLEPDPDGELDPFAIRLGLRFLSGAPRHELERLVAAREVRPFADLTDLRRRAQVSDGTLRRLAEAGALAAFGHERRDALWVVSRPDRGDSLDLPEPTRAPRFAALADADQIFWDYRTHGMSVRGHPMSTIREDLDARGLPDAWRVTMLPDGARTHYVGLVICRQRPGTAGGVVFMTLEDETGFVNLVLWKDVFERYNILARTRPVLGVTGRVQSEEGVVHLIADELWEPLRAPEHAKPRSRDFH